jgi:hypothetical protein
MGELNDERLKASRTEERLIISGIFHRISITIAHLP